MFRPRISVTDLDGYAYFKQADYLEFDEYLRRIFREEPESLPMKIGKAFHGVLEQMHLENKPFQLTPVRPVVPDFAGRGPG